MYLAMRAVMLVGGFCAEGGPYEIRQHCPKGVVGFMFGGIWGGAIMIGIYLWQTSKHHVPSLIYLAWPALFLSLGWNFLYFGLNPPGSEGVAWGWLVCAIAFAVMGGLPLLLIKPILRPFFSDDADPPPKHPFEGGAILGLRRDSGSSLVTDVSTVEGREGSVTDQLERLAALHRSGDIDDTEYEAAKRRILS